jgi:hypothetical protein
VIQAEQPIRTLEPGTLLAKAIPPRLVEPYLTGRRSVIAGYVYRAQDCSFSEPAGYFEALALGYNGSEFTADMPELYVLRWPVLEMSATLLPVPPTPTGPASAVPEFYTLPMQVPIGAEIYRITTSAEEFIARYDGQVWLRPLREV